MFFCGLISIENRMSLEKFTKRFSELEVGALLFCSLVQKIRIANGRKAKISFVVTSQGVKKNTDTAKEKGYDAWKKVSGIKRHIAVDSQDLPHVISAAAENLTTSV